MKKDAIISPCRKYRYLLTRVWEQGPSAGFICLNPSTADATEDDPTVRRCIGFAKSWGYSGIAIANLFAFRATNPRVMLAADDPIGPHNDTVIKEVCSQVGIVVAAWGASGAYLNRAAAVRALIPELHYLDLTRHGQPKHPLYLPAHLKPVRWAGT